MKLESATRVRSASVGRTRDYERRHRYWAFLLDHLNRLIDEIYQNCEEDESIDECREVILLLQNHIRDFESLIEWLKLNINLETTPQRPNSVSWEVRKRLPKHPIWSCYYDTEKVKTPDRRVLKFGKVHKFNKVDEVVTRSSSIENQNDETISNDCKNESKYNSESFKNSLETESVNVNVNVQNGNNACHNQDLKQVEHSNLIEKNAFLNRCNSLNNIPRSPKCILDEDGFQVVRYKQRNKVTRLKIVDNKDEIKLENQSPWALLDNNGVGDNRIATPCRALQLHEKFSSPSRKRPIHDTLKKHEEKQAKAQEAREKLLEKKAGKFKGIVKKVEEIKAQKEEQQLQLKLSMEMRLQRADEKRQEQINKIVRKAHDEDSKVNEILFINSLEADHKKHEIFSKEKVFELRLQDLQEERQRKLEEKASKEAAFEKRRKAIEEEKQARIEKLKEQRKLKVMKIQQQLQEKEKERMELAFQKELDRKSKISALNALHAAEKEELQKKILTKQEESKRRHEENMEQIRQKALELSVRKSSSGISDDALVCVPYDTVKMCALCKVIIKSEVYLFGHLRGKKHNDAIKEQNDGKIPSVEELENYNLKNIIDASLHPDGGDLKTFQDCFSEKLKQARKKSKKLKLKITTRVDQLEKKWSFPQIDSNIPNKENKLKFSKSIKELNLLHSNDRISGQWPVNMIRSVERAFSDFEKLCKSDQHHVNYFLSINGIPLLTKILSRILNGTTERPTSLTDNANNKLVSFYKYLFTESFDVCKYFLHSNNIIIMLDILYHRINLCVNSNLNSFFPYDSVVGSLCDFFSVIFERIFQFYSHGSDDKDFIIQHLKDIINYLVIIGVIDKLSMILSSIRGSVNELPQQSIFVKQIITLFSSISKLLTLLPSCNFNDISYGIKLMEDDTQFMLTLRVNQLCGTVSLLYGFLLHSGTPVRDDNVPPKVPQHTLDVALETIRFLNYIAILDINLIQSILGGEGLSLQIRHLCSYLIWYCSHHISNSELLHEVTLLIGNFVVLNVDNQRLLQSGHRPTVVQQLCSLPFEYFSEECLKQILFPTLIVSCFQNCDNANVLKQEMSPSMLSKFIDNVMVNSQLEQIENKTNNKTIVGEKWAFSMRFPKSRWSEAKFYFDDIK